MRQRRERAFFAAWGALGLFVFALAPGCDSGADTYCYPGDYIGCYCAGPAYGYARCTPEGDAYAPCDCTSPVPGSQVDAGDAGDAGDRLPYMSECPDDAACESGLCYPFTAKGPHCTIPCTSDSECPAPSTGCNNKGICKAP